MGAVHLSHQTTNTNRSDSSATALAMERFFKKELIRVGSMPRKLKIREKYYFTIYMEGLNSQGQTE